MPKLESGDALQLRRSAVSKGISKIKCAPQVALVSLLAGCAANAADVQIFDYVDSASQTAAVTPLRTSSQTEKPKVKSAATLLGAQQNGPDYTVEADVPSDGIYNIYTFSTKYGIYSVTGDYLAQKHIQELVALDTLTKYSKAEEFVGGVGNAVASPVKAVYYTVTDPVEAADRSYTNVRRKLISARRSVSEAGEYISSFGNVPKKRPDREDDGVLEKFVDRPKAKRRLARALGVDSYTHFVPLADKLDDVASYSSAGEFAIDRAIGFVPGVAGTVISSVQTLDSLTEQTLDMDPGEIAAVNRERLEKLDMPENTIKRLLLNDKFTPSEKAQAVGYLSRLSDTPGIVDLANFTADSDTRPDAFASLLTLKYLSTRPFRDDRITDVRIIDDFLVLMIGDSKSIVILTSDDLAWTPPNADRLSKLGTALKAPPKKGAKKEIRISGNASPLARNELKRYGWIVKTKAFRDLGLL